MILRYVLHKLVLLEKIWSDMPCLLNNVKHANNRTGVEAVMGSKNLRAIAVIGTQEVSVKDRD